MHAMHSIFCALDSKRMAEHIRNAKHRVCYAAPGLQLAVAKAIREALMKLPADAVTVSIDFDERVMRMGYGHIDAIRLLNDANIPVMNSPGLRSAVLIVDDEGFVFTPTALYLENEPQSVETPNAIRLQREQICEVLIRLSRAAKEEAIAAASSEQERQELAAIPIEVGVDKVSPHKFLEVAESLRLAPPVAFDVAKQVQVFQPYLQYVEIKLHGAAIQRHRVEIPKAIQKLGASKDLEGRLRTTFDLIKKDSKVSSKALENELNKIRKDLTRELGRKFGRVILKSVRARFDERIGEFRKKLEAHQKTVKATIEGKLIESRKQVVEHYLPIAADKPPDELLGGLLMAKPTKNDIRKWLDAELGKVFPSADKLTLAMTLEVSFKDVTYETLNQPEFFNTLKEAYPNVNWDKPYGEFLALGEKDGEGGTAGL